MKKEKEEIKLVIYKAAFVVLAGATLAALSYFDNHKPSALEEQPIYYDMENDSIEEEIVVSKKTR